MTYPSLVQGFHDDDTTFADVTVYYLAGVIFLTAFPCLNFGSAYRQMRKRTELSKNPITFCDRDFTTVIECTLMTFIILAVQLISHHCYYIILAIIASPIHSLSFLLLYSASIFCTVMVAIIILKLYFKNILGIIECICLGVLYPVVMISVIYVIITLMSLVGEHHDSGTVSVITEMTWSVVLFLLGCCGKKMFSWLG